ncbi:MAG TPA: MFS transporter [Verrucomicrobiae bacterium]|nr:MFS transporter [Verrucomicrobiae bacterium]
MNQDTQPAFKLHLALGTISFIVCFAAWGLVSAFAPEFRKIFQLSATQTAALVAAPVLLGSLARLPIGMLTDRAGGRFVFSALMIICAVPAFLIPRAASFQQLIWIAFALGLAGSSFSVGVGYVSRWTPPEKQGGALGVYGLGNIGQSAAVFLGPVIAASYGWQSVYRGMAVVLIVWAVLFALMARNAPGANRPASVGEMVKVLTREKLSWVLALFYFLTFGGFVAFAIYLPLLLRDEFQLSVTDAGFRAAGFVVLATLLRPVGGWLADRIGGARVLAGVFPGIALFALLLAWPAMIPFSVGALGCAALLGLGNGAVFKLVPQYFPRETATVGGLVGAFGGLGGFFPPLMLGLFQEKLGVIWPGFVLLSMTSLTLWFINRKVFLARQETAERSFPVRTRTAEQLRAGAWATMWTGILVAAIVVGSRNLQNFDAALVIYTFACIFSWWGVTYHYYVWLQKPPTQLYWRRGWEMFFKDGIFRSLARTSVLGTRNIAFQTFIYHRSRLRWWMHQFLFWGCILAAAITFPLVFGWIYFESAPGDQMTYVTYVFGFPVMSFALRTILSWIIFHGLDIAAVLVIAGIALSLWRRMLDRGAQAVQSFGMDFLPIILLFAISITGLALTVSSLWVRGQFYGFLSILHAITVVAALLFLPFGKFFHIFQRPAQLGVKFYHAAGDKDEGSYCARCGQRFASRMHVEDLKFVLRQLDFNYSMAGPAGNWQQLCPPCKRKSIATAQLRLKDEHRANNNALK